MGLFWDFHCYPMENLQLFVWDHHIPFNLCRLCFLPLSSLDRREGGADIPCDCVAISLPCYGDTFWLFFGFLRVDHPELPKSQLAIMTTLAWGARAVKVLPMVPPPGHKLGSLLPYVQVPLPTATVVSWSRQKLKEQHPHSCPRWSPELGQREALARY